MTARDDAVEAVAGYLSSASANGLPVNRVKLGRAIDMIPTDVVKALVTERSIADAAAAYNHHMEVADMSKNPSRQRAEAKRAAKADKAHWRGQRDKAKDDTSRATYQRGMDRAQRDIDRNS